ncbi:MAG: hypothetical protein LBP54_00315 [Campylobacteraceae bacterium]|nr:hypothetical protein [Campylobacteraceae bacterium]
MSFFVSFRFPLFCPKSAHVAFGDSNLTICVSAGNAVAAVVVGAWDKQIEMKKFKHTMDNPKSVHSVL